MVKEIQIYQPGKNLLNFGIPYKSVGDLAVIVLPVEVNRETLHS